MSAYMCSNRELTALAIHAVRHCFDAVPADMRRELDPPRIGHHGPLERTPGAFNRTVARIVSMLASENLASLHARYGEPATAEMFDETQVDRPTLLATTTRPPMHIVKACHHYAYQACEHAGWADSAARKLIDAIEQDAVRRLPGYVDAPWGF